MKVLVKSRPSSGADLVEVPLPKVKPDEVLVKVSAASICGSDLHIYSWDEWASQRIALPRVSATGSAGMWSKSGKR